MKNWKFHFEKSHKPFFNIYVCPETQKQIDIAV